jgi:excisionase family DNA binding protein
MENTNELLTATQAAQRLGISVRRVQDLMAKNQLLAHKVGKGYRVWSREVDRLARLSRPRGRPRRLTASDGELGIWTVDVAGDVQRAHTREQMEAVLQEYIDWLDQHQERVVRLQPGMTPHQVALTNIELSTRNLPDEQRATWIQVLQREVNRERTQQLAHHLVAQYGLNVKVRDKNALEWCVDLYAFDDEVKEWPKTTIYEAAVHSSTMPTAPAGEMARYGGPDPDRNPGSA